MMAQNWGSVQGCSIKPNWIQAFAPAASASIPFIAPVRSPWNAASLIVVEATACKARGHAATLNALTLVE